MDECFFGDEKGSWSRQSIWLGSWDVISPPLITVMFYQYNTNALVTEKSICRYAYAVSSALHNVGNILHKEFMIQVWSFAFLFIWKVDILLVPSFFPRQSRDKEDLLLPIWKKNVSMRELLVLEMLNTHTNYSDHVVCGILANEKSTEWALASLISIHQFHVIWGACLRFFFVYHVLRACL